jgi:ribonuclease HI
MMPMALVTMFTDASMQRAQGIAVWASWAKCNGNTIRYSGRLKKLVEHIGTAELSAIANGLVAIEKNFDCAKDSKIIIQTDSRESIDAILKAKHNRAEDTVIVKYILQFAKSHGWWLDLRHVKGHKGTITPRHAVNSWCDGECHRLMGEIILQQKKEQKANGTSTRRVAS